MIGGGLIMVLKMAIVDDDTLFLQDIEKISYEFLKKEKVIASNDTFILFAPIVPALLLFVNPYLDFRLFRQFAPFIFVYFAYSCFGPSALTCLISSVNI